MMMMMIRSPRQTGGDGWSTWPTLGDTRNAVRGAAGSPLALMAMPLAALAAPLALALALAALAALLPLPLPIDRKSVV